MAAPCGVNARSLEGAVWKGVKTRSLDSFDSGRNHEDFDGYSNSNYRRSWCRTKGGGLDGATSDDSSGLQSIAYNVCSLIGEGRIDMLLQELDGLYWDVIVISETRRDPSDESFGVPGNQMFYGAGAAEENVVSVS